MIREVLAWGAVVVVSGVVTMGCTSSSAGDPGGGAGDADGGGATGPQTVTVDATTNALALDSCGVTPALISNVPAGTYTITLTASTLTKGGVSGQNPAPPSVDNYVIVHLPLPPGDPDEVHRFFMLNGVGASASITLPAAGTIQVMFVDSDFADNSGTGTVTLSPGNYGTTVDAVANDLAYDAGCHSTPATQVIAGGMWRATLLDSTFSSGAGAHDDFVLVRTPNEQPMDDHRYVILNGVGANDVFTPFNSQTVRLWYIGASAGTGVAHVQLAPL